MKTTPFPVSPARRTSSKKPILALGALAMLGLSLTLALRSGTADPAPFASSPAATARTSGPVSGGRSALPKLVTEVNASVDPTTEKAAEEERFQRQVSNLVETCQRTPPCDERKLLMDQAAVGFDRWLGLDHPRRPDLIEIIGWSYDERQVLTVQFQGGALGRTQMFEKLSQHFQSMSQKFASILTDEEYLRAFGTAKGVNPAKLLNLTEEKAKALDEEKKSAG